MTVEKINKMNTAMIAVLKIAYLNLLWLITVIAGLGIFTFGPATYAMMKYYDQWLRLKEEPPVAKSFYRYFKENFKQSFLVGLFYEFTIFVIAANLFTVANWYLQVGNIIVLLVILCSFTHVFTLMSAIGYSKILDLFKATSLLGFGYLHYTIICWTIIAAFYLICSAYVPAVIFLFGGGLVGFILSTAGRIVLKDLFTRV